MQVIKRLAPLFVASGNASSWGETPLPFAPKIRLNNGTSIVPQQYLVVERSVANVETILQNIEFSDDYILFVNQENGIISLQVGIIGCENYPSNSQQEHENKIVYGRRWLIESTTPTSEVIQTALLALKKAREHELRENVYVMLNHKTKTTPFNTHQDLPLMKRHSSFFKLESKTTNSNQTTIRSRVDSILASFKLKSFNIKLDTITEISNHKYLIELKLNSTQPNIHFSEFINCSVAILWNNITETQFMHELMNALIQISERYVEENFTFDGFARFSDKLCPKKIAEFSSQTRNIKHKDSRFDHYFRQMSYDVDSTKAPTFSTNELGEKQRGSINKHKVSAGYLPYEPEQTDSIVI